MEDMKEITAPVLSAQCFPLNAIPRARERDADFLHSLHVQCPQSFGDDLEHMLVPRHLTPQQPWGLGANPQQISRDGSPEC